MLEKHRKDSWEKMLEEELRKKGFEDEFCISDEIEGYERCEGFVCEKCLSDCAFYMMQPVASSIN